MLRRFSVVVWALLLSSFPLKALPQKLGDLDEDGKRTVLDIYRIVSHINKASSLSPERALFADVNQDGFVNEIDAGMVAEAILGLAQLPEFPFLRIRETSPAHGEGDVAVTRETVIRFTLPLSTNTIFTTQNFHAEFGGA